MIIASTVLCLVGAALWTLAVHRHRLGLFVVGSVVTAIHLRSALDVVSVVTFPDCGLDSTVPYHVGAALWPLAIHRRSALDVVSVVIA